MRSPVMSVFDLIASYGEPLRTRSLRVAERLSPTRQAGLAQQQEGVSRAHSRASTLVDMEWLDDEMKQGASDSKRNRAPSVASTRASSWSPPKEWQVEEDTVPTALHISPDARTGEGDGHEEKRLTRSIWLRLAVAFVPPLALLAAIGILSLALATPTTAALAGLLQVDASTGSLLVGLLGTCTMRSDGEVECTAKSVTPVFAAAYDALGLSSATVAALPFSLPILPSAVILCIAALGCAAVGAALAGRVLPRVANVYAGSLALVAAAIGMATTIAQLVSFVDATADLDNVSLGDVFILLWSAWATAVVGGLLLVWRSRSGDVDGAV